MFATISQSPSMTPPPPLTRHQLRVEFYTFEKCSLAMYIENTIEALKCSHPTTKFPSFKMLTHHKLSEFPLSSEQSSTPAYGFFKLNTQLVQMVNPPELFFVSTLYKASEYFPGSSYIASEHQPPGVIQTVLNLTTESGHLPTPPILQATPHNIIILKEFSLSILMENLSFATYPFDNWKPVETCKGFLLFPKQPSLWASLPVQQQQTHPGGPPSLSMFSFPPPQIRPPRLYRSEYTSGYQCSLGY